ncbi:hypothetical protein ACH46L_11050 [Streptomyces althioticus]
MEFFFLPCGIKDVPLFETKGGQHGTGGAAENQIKKEVSKIGHH